MPVTELGFFRLKDNTPITSPSLLINLLKAKHTCEEYTARHSGNTTATFRWWHSLEDPELIYYVGSWGSIVEHKEQFAPSDENQALRGLLGDKIRIERYFHLSLDQSQVDVSAAFGRAGLAIMRYHIKPGQRGEAEKVVQVIAENANNRTGPVVVRPARTVGGWRLDKEAEDREEYVEFCGLESAEQLRSAVSSPEKGNILEEANDLHEFSDRVEVAHGILLDHDAAFHQSDTAALEEEPQANIS